MTPVHGMRARLCEQRGQALILAMVIILVGLVLGFVAVAYALSTGGSNVHDQRTRAAQQAADAGIAGEQYLQSDLAAVGYDIPGSGTLGVSALVDCVVPPGGLTGATSLAGYINSVGQCVPVGGAASKCSLTISALASTCDLPWNPAGDQAYYESEWFPNSEQQSNGSAAGNSFDVLFPEIVSLGCSTTTQPTSANPTAATAACQAGTGTEYSRRLALLAPTAPLQAIEAGNDATVYGNGLLINLATPLETLAGDLDSIPVINLLLPGLSATLNGVEALCAAPLLSTVLSDAGSLLSTLGLTASGVSTTCTEVNSLTSASLAAINGNISAGHDLYLPSTVVGVNTTGEASLTGGLASAVGTIVSSLGNVATNLVSANSTFEYGDDNNGDSGDLCNVSYAGSSPPSATKCTPQSDSSSPVAAVGAALVQAKAGACVAGEPSTDCTLQRPTFRLSTSPATTLPGSITYTGTKPSIGATPGSQGYGILTIPSGTTAIFGTGTYVFCGLYAQGTITTTSGGVQIFILAPGANGCSSTTGSGSAPDPGSFVACAGISNTLTGGGLDGVTSVVNPSAFQVYLQGDSSYQSQSTDSAVSSCPYASGGAYTAPSGADPDTQFYAGNTTTTLTQAFVVYAPASEVTINSASIFEGSAIGWNVDVTAAAVIQDFDLGNYPLSSVINSDQIAQDVQCDSSVVPLTDTPPTYGTATPGTLTSGGDLSGCT